MSHPIPEGFHTLTPHIIVSHAGEALTFYAKAFGAQEQRRILMPGTETVMYAQMKLGDSQLMLGSEFPPSNLGPKSRGGTSTFLHLYIPDADALFDRAVTAGCTVRMPMSDTFWGYRYGVVEDPFGHQWSLATHKQDFTPAQIEANAREFMGKMRRS